MLFFYSYVKAEKKEKDAVLTRPANRSKCNSFQDFNFPSKTDCLILSSRKLSGGPSNTVNVDTHHTTVTNDTTDTEFRKESCNKGMLQTDSLDCKEEIFSSVAESSLHGSDDGTLVSHAEKSVSNCLAPASTVSEIPVAKSRKIKLNGNKSMGCLYGNNNDCSDCILLL